jgi:hypothetical protein
MGMYELEMEVCRKMEIKDEAGEGSMRDSQV